MELEENNQLPFLDILIIKESDLNLGHTVYRKNTHTNRYLNAKSHHHPKQIHSVPITLAHRSKRLTDNNHLESELQLLRDALLKNGFSNNEITKAFNYKTKDKTTEDNNNISTVLLPYIKGTTDKISNVLRRNNIKTIFNTYKKIQNYMRPVKDKIPLESHGVYEIPCKNCNQTYIGQTNRKISARLYEHKLSVRNLEAKSTLAKHVQETHHEIDFNETKLISNTMKCGPRLVREAIEIEKRNFCMNLRDDGRNLPAVWKTTLYDRKILPDHNEISNENILIPPTIPSTTVTPSIEPIVENISIFRRITRSLSKNLNL